MSEWTSSCKLKCRRNEAFASAWIWPWASKEWDYVVVVIWPAPFPRGLQMSWGFNRSLWFPLRSLPLHSLWSLWVQWYCCFFPRLGALVLGQPSPDISPKISFVVSLLLKYCHWAIWDQQIHFFPLFSVETSSLSFLALKATTCLRASLSQTRSIMSLESLDLKKKKGRRKEPLTSRSFFSPPCTYL